MAKGDRTLSADQASLLLSAEMMSMLKFSLDLGLERETCSLSGFAGSKGFFLLQKEKTLETKKNNTRNKSGNPALRIFGFFNVIFMAKRAEAEIFGYIAKMKEIERTGWKRNGVKNPESVADHSFSTSLLTMIISDRLGLNTGKAIRMALLHDMAESVTGDITTPEKEKMGHEKVLEMERRALKEIFSSFPEKISKEYTELVEELIEGKTDEASLVNEIDKLEMLLQARHYQETRKIDLGTFNASAKKIKRSELLRILD